jgi:effector-binding domain-containing protein
MDIEIFTQNLQLCIYGFGGISTNKDYIGTAFNLSSKMWEVIKANSIMNKGKNVWVYETGDRVFAGVEVENYATKSSVGGLEEMKISLEKYAYFKHIGPYTAIKEMGHRMRSGLTRRGFEIILPYIEIYGHWTNQETELETELIMCLK